MAVSLCRDHLSAGAGARSRAACRPGRNRPRSAVRRFGLRLPGRAEHLVRAAQTLQLELAAAVERDLTAVGEPLQGLRDEDLAARGLGRDPRREDHAAAEEVAL